MTFNKGAELDKQIYKEGEQTWGLKSGFLDVDDVKKAVKELKDNMPNLNVWNKKEKLNLNIYDIIYKIFGEKLTQ